MEAKFKVGDIITPDLEMLEKYRIGNASSIWEAVGKHYKVDLVNPDGSIRIVPLTGDISPNGWLPKFWQLSKNHIVTQILNDL